MASERGDSHGGPRRANGHRLRVTKVQVQILPLLIICGVTWDE